MAVSTSIVISFKSQEAADAANAILTAELDTRDDGYNAGRSSFLFGDQPVYLIYKTSNVTFDQYTTAGSTQYVGNVTIEVDEVITFLREQEASISKPPSTAVTFTLIGGDGMDTANLTVSGTRVTYSPDDPEATPPLAVVRATYNTTALAYRLIGVTDPQIDGLEDYPVVIYILGDVTV